MVNIMLGTLYLIATPIGNLKDISFRAIETLKSVDLIACEDTRHTRKLLNHCQISNTLISYHEHNEADRAEELAKMLEDGRSIAVVSDAGTPGICDPSYRVVERANEIGAAVVAIPGPVAFVSALIVSGLPTDSVFFGGFLPSKAGDRRKRLESVKGISATLVFYETPHRIAAALADCAAVLGNRRIALARELTKLHEEVIRGRLNEVINAISDAKIKGEIVLVIDREETGGRVDASTATLTDRMDEIMAAGTDHRSALKQAAKELGLSRSGAYRIFQSEKE